MAPRKHFRRDRLLGRRVLDSQRDRLYIGPGGGHGGYNGNEVYAFDLHDLKWHRLTDPDPVIPGTEYTDLNKSPFAMHTYDGVEYLPPPVDRYVVIGGWNTPRTYALDPDHPRHWEIYADHGTGRTGDYCAYDPIGQLLWLNTPITAGKLSQWDPLSHRWTLRLASSPEPSYYETADIDFHRRLLVACGRGKLKVTRLAEIPALMTCRVVQASGDKEVADAPSPGFCFVPSIDEFVAWANGPDVYTLNADTWRWTRHPPAATNRAVPGPAQQWGTFGRFRYVPSRNLFILCNGVKQNVYLYRLTADKPNPITGVRAKVLRKSLELSIPAAAVSAQAVYADGSRKDVTREADYSCLDPSVAKTELHGKGVVTGVSVGAADPGRVHRSGLQARLLQRGRRRGAARQARCHARRSALRRRAADDGCRRHVPIACDRLLYARCRPLHANWRRRSALVLRHAGSRGDIAWPRAAPSVPENRQPSGRPLAEKPLRLQSPWRTRP